MNNKFSSLLGNEKLKSIMSKDIEEKRISHAYLIEGPDGSGKHTFALDIIRAISCRGGGGSIPCNTCEICRKINSGFFSDISYINSGENATISVEKIRDMTSTVNYVPDEDVPYKFYIIENAERMTPSAQNALLLTLEEPPKYVVFFLLTDDSQSLLETVRSRVITLKTEVFSPESVIEFLKTFPEFSSLSREKLRSAAVISKGAPGMALKILKGNSGSESVFSDADKMVSLITDGNAGELLLFCSALKPERQICDSLFDYVLSAFRDLIAYKNGFCRFTFFDSEENVSSICRRMTLSKLYKIYEEVEKAKNDICKANANINLVMIDLAAKTAL